jgi:uncharacterized protein YecE (DUF72 family)
VRVHVGTSGWQYASWRERFYPKDVAQRLWLPYYAERFSCVEVNNTFYNLPAEETFRAWREATPPDFQFVLKASRYLTHIRRLREPEDPVRLFMERSRPLRRRVAAVLLQLPPRFRIDLDRLRDTLRAFPRTLRVAVEFRDPSWYADSVRELLAQHGAALCRADRGGQIPEPDWPECGWSYLRMHQGEATPMPCYGKRILEERAAALARAVPTIADAFVFFNNDERACALRDASLFAAACAQERGLDVTRVPPPVTPAH